MSASPSERTEKNVISRHSPDFSCFVTKVFPKTGSSEAVAARVVITQGHSPVGHVLQVRGLKVRCVH